MRYLRICLIFIFYCGIHFFVNAQKGNYVIRDSTSNLPTINNNTIVGTKAAIDLNGASSGNDNTLFGSYAGFKLNTGGGFNQISGLTIIGSRAGYNYLTTTRGITNATFIGAFAGYNDGTGVSSINNGTRGGTFIGYKAGYAGGNPESIAIGVEAGLTGVSTNTILIGASAGALRASYTQSNNDVFIGTRAGYNFGGQDNTFVGNNAGSGSDTQIIGGYENVYLGANAGQLSSSNANTFVGANTGKLNQSAQNTFMGNSSGLNITGNNSNGNTFIGYSSGLLVSGSYNTFLGYNADGFDSQTFLTKSVAIGYNAKVSANNSFILGGTGVDAVNVGIGNTAPNNKLEITSATTNTSGLRFTNLKSTSTPTTSNSLGLSVDVNGDVILVPAGGGTLPQGADVWDQLTNGADYLIRNKNNKSVMIGTVAATKTSIDYKLYVEKGVLSEKFKVSAQANWPDYVFAKNYSLMPLKEVETFIATNNRLPEVPSATTIEIEGLDLGKMDATLLKKVEELTLYLIEQNKKIENLQAEVIRLKSQK